MTKTEKSIRARVEEIADEASEAPDPTEPLLEFIERVRHALDEKRSEAESHHLALQEELDELEGRTEEEADEIETE